MTEAVTHHVVVVITHLTRGGTTVVTHGNIEGFGLAIGQEIGFVGVFCHCDILRSRLYDCGATAGCRGRGCCRADGGCGCCPLDDTDLAVKRPTVGCFHIQHHHAPIDHFSHHAGFRENLLRGDIQDPVRSKHLADGGGGCLVQGAHMGDRLWKLDNQLLSDRHPYRDGFFAEDGLFGRNRHREGKAQSRRDQAAQWGEDKALHQIPLRLMTCCCRIAPGDRRRSSNQLRGRVD